MFGGGENNDCVCMYVCMYIRGRVCVVMGLIMIYGEMRLDQESDSILRF